MNPDAADREREPRSPPLEQVASNESVASSRPLTKSIEHLQVIRASSSGGARMGSREFNLEARNEEGTLPDEDDEDAPVTYRTYKRRWFGLAQLTLMNVIVSWDWLTYAPVASKAAEYYSVRESTINWLSTSFFLAFVFIFPVTIFVLNRSLRMAFLIAAALILVGNWIRYAGSTSRDGGSIVSAMVGEILIGFAQPFVLAMPTRYSDLWFTDQGRVAATAITTLANPLGAAVGQLVNPFWVSESGDISSMVLYVSILSTISCVPALFVPAKPPTPVGPSSVTPKLRLSQSLRVLSRSPEVWLILVPFAIFVGFFNSISSLINQMMTPYGFSDDEAGIGGAILIVVGLIASAISSPILDRNKKFLLAIKTLIPIVALSFLAFTWMPETRSLAGPYVVLAILGASCFCLVPVALEYLIELSHPISPEVTSTTAWAGGQLFGAIFILISDALRAGKDGNPPRNMKNALIFQAIVTLVTSLLPLSLGLFGRVDKVGLKRIESDVRSRREERLNDYEGT